MPRCVAQPVRGLQIAGRRGGTHLHGLAVDGQLAIDPRELADHHVGGEPEADDGLRTRRLVDQFVRGAERDESSGRDDRDAVREPVGLFHVVGGEQDGLADVAQARHDVPRLPASRRVEPGGGLVEEEQIGVADQPEREIDPAALPAGQRPGAFVGLAAESDEVDHLVDVPRAGVEAGVVPQEFAGTEPVLHPGFLQDDPDPLTVGATAGLRVAAEHLDVPARPLPVALEDLHRGRLAGAVRADDRDDLALLDGEVQTSYGVGVAVVLVQVPDHDRRHDRSSPRRAREHERRHAGWPSSLVVHQRGS
jgi:hypothetical protein